jgi:hypothetical protein
METVIIVVIIALFVIVPLLILGVWPGDIKFKKTPGNSIEEPEVSKAEILEEMCRLEQTALLRETIRREARLSDAERTLLTKKLWGDDYLSPAFPVRDAEKGEEIKRWLSNPRNSDPLMPLIIQVPVDCATIEGILRRVLHPDLYESSYQIAKARAIAKKEIMNKTLTKVMEIPPDKVSERFEMYSKMYKDFSDIDRGGWRDYLDRKKS